MLDLCHEVLVLWYTCSRVSGNSTIRKDRKFFPRPGLFGMTMTADDGSNTIAHTADLRELLQSALSKPHVWERMQFRPFLPRDGLSRNAMTSRFVWEHPMFHDREILPEGNHIFTQVHWG